MKMSSCHFLLYSLVVFSSLGFMYLQGATIGDLSVTITPVDDYQLPPEAQLPSSPVSNSFIHVYKAFEVMIIDRLW